MLPGYTHSYVQRHTLGSSSGLGMARLFDITIQHLTRGLSRPPWSRLTATRHLRTLHRCLCLLASGHLIREVVRCRPSSLSGSTSTSKNRRVVILVLVISVSSLSPLSVPESVLAVDVLGVEVEYAGSKVWSGDAGRAWHGRPLPAIISLASKVALLFSSSSAI
jgi:hypothetical protein